MASEGGLEGGGAGGSAMVTNGGELGGDHSGMGGSTAKTDVVRGHKIEGRFLCELPSSASRLPQSSQSASSYGEHSTHVVTFWYMFGAVARCIVPSLPSPQI